MIVLNLDIKITLKKLHTWHAPYVHFFCNLSIQILGYHLLLPHSEGRCIGEIIIGWKGSSAGVEELFLNILTRVFSKNFIHKPYHWTEFFLNLLLKIFWEYFFIGIMCCEAKNWEEFISIHTV